MKWFLFLTWSKSLVLLLTLHPFFRWVSPAWYFFRLYGPPISSTIRLDPLLTLLQLLLPTKALDEVPHSSAESSSRIKGLGSRYWRNEPRIQVEHFSHFWTVCCGEDLWRLHEDTFVVILCVPLKRKETHNLLSQPFNSKSFLSPGRILAIIFRVQRQLIAGAKSEIASQSFFFLLLWQHSSAHKFLTILLKIMCDWKVAKSDTRPQVALS